jgi:hypothetical protein
MTLALGSGPASCDNPSEGPPAHFDVPNGGLERSKALSRPLCTSKYEREEYDEGQPTPNPTTLNGLA